MRILARSQTGGKTHIDGPPVVPRRSSIRGRQPASSSYDGRSRYDDLYARRSDDPQTWILHLRSGMKFTMGPILTPPELLAPASLTSTGVRFRPIGFSPVLEPQSYVYRQLADRINELASTAFFENRSDFKGLSPKLRRFVHMPDVINRFKEMRLDE